VDNELEITQLLQSWQDGNETALDDLSKHVHGELHKLANKYMKNERVNHTLQPTALVNEAFISLINANVNFKDRLHFYSLSGQIMRRILVDHARTKSRVKRGGGEQELTLMDSHAFFSENVEILSLDYALNSLAAFDQQKAQILELQFFAGLQIDEIAEIFCVSSKTIERNCKFAKAWLHKALC